MVSIGTVENENFLWGWGVLKTAIFLDNGRRPYPTRYSSMNDRIAPGIWSPFLSTTSPSYPTCHRYLWKIIVKDQICWSSPPPKKKEGVFDETHPSPEIFYHFRPYLSEPHIRIFSLGLPELKMIKIKKIWWALFSNCTYDFWIMFRWFSLKGPNRFFCCQSIKAQGGPNVES